MKLKLIALIMIGVISLGTFIGFTEKNAASKEPEKISKFKNKNEKTDILRTIICI